MGKEFVQYFQQFCRVMFGYPQHNRLWCNPFTDPYGMPMICVPCKLRHFLPQLLSVRAIRGPGKGRPILCTDAPLNMFRCCRCDVDGAFNDGDMYFCDCEYCCGPPYSSTAQPNFWRREVQEWQREVKAKKKLRSRACAVVSLLEMKHSRHHRSRQPRGGRHKSGEHATRLGFD